MADMPKRIYLQSPFSDWTEEKIHDSDEYIRADVAESQHLLDQFAMATLIGALAQKNFAHDFNFEDRAVWAYDQAVAMISERSKRQ